MYVIGNRTKRNDPDDLDDKSEVHEHLPHTICPLISAVVQLSGMVAKALPCEVKFPVPYGCYCGPNPSNEVGSAEPIDEFDMVCLTHDNCYEVAEGIEDCSYTQSHVNTYSWDWVEEEKQVKYCFRLEMCLLCARPQDVSNRTSETRVANNKVVC